jgi:hypothetical protein
MSAKKPDVFKQACITVVRDSITKRSKALNIHTIFVCSGY